MSGSVDKRGLGIRPGKIFKKGIQKQKRGVEKLQRNKHDSGIGVIQLNVDEEFIERGYRAEHRHHKEDKRDGIDDFHRLKLILCDNVSRNCIEKHIQRNIHDDEKQRIQIHSRKVDVYVWNGKLKCVDPILKLPGRRQSPNIFYKTVCRLKRIDKHP